MFLTPGSRASRFRITPTAGSTVAAALGPFTPLQSIFANSSNTITGMTGSNWNDTARALTLDQAGTGVTTSGGQVTAIGNGNSWGFAIETYGSNLFADGMLFRKERGAYHSFTLVQSSDQITEWRFQGADGVAYRTAAEMFVEVDGVAAAGSMPGRFRFMTTPSGTTTAVERIRLDSGGNTTIAPEGFGASPLLAALSINNNVAGNWSFNIVEYGNSAASAGLGYYKTRGTVPSSHVAVTTGDNISEWDFYGDDGTTRQLGAMMRVTVDGAVSAGVVPLQWEFWTGQSGGTNNIRAIIDSTGRVIVGSTVDPLINTFPTVFTVAGNGNTTNGQNFLTYGNLAGTTGLLFSKTRGTVPSSIVSIASSDTIGEQYYFACNGSGYQEIARMGGYADGLNGTVVPSSMWGRLGFFTNHGGATASERMRLDSAGTLWFLRSSGASIKPANVSGCVNETVACYNHQAYGGI